MTGPSGELGKAGGWYWPTAPANAPSLSLVIPAFNEEQRLPRLLTGLKTSCDPSTQVIVVDDGSQDATADIAEAGLGGFTNHLVLRSNKNRGKGFALRRGVAAAIAPRVVFMDADMATDLSDIATVLEALTTADVAAGSRLISGAEVEGSPLYRRIMRASFNLLVRRATATNVTDTQCGFKAFHTPVARLLFSLATYDGFGLDLELLDLASRLRFDIAEVPVHWEAVPGSKVRPLLDSAVLAGAALRLGMARPSTTFAILSQPLGDSLPTVLGPTIAKLVPWGDSVLATNTHLHVLSGTGLDASSERTAAALAAGGFTEFEAQTTTTASVIAAFRG